MRKNILFIVICFITMFMFSDRVMAVVDNSLNYDIETFNLTEDNKLTISGWAFIHNKNNYGGMSQLEYTYTNDSNSQIKSLTKQNNALSVYFYFMSGDSKIGINSDGEYDISATFSGNRDMTELLCYKSGGGCLEDTPTEEKWSVYYNVGFNVTIDLNEYHFDNSKDYKLMIVGKLGTKNSITKEREVAVASGVANTTATDNFEISDLSNKIDVSGNHVLVNDESGGYWKLTTMIFKNGSLKADIDNSEYYYGVRSGFNSDGYSLYKLYFDKKVSTGSVKERCGWEADGSLIETKCTVPSKDGEGSTGIIKSYFVNVIGSVKMKYVGEDDKVCPIQNGNGVITDCNGDYVYSCDSLMTVKTMRKGIEYKADVLPMEDVSLELDNDYTGITLGAGNGFDFGITYTDMVTFKIKDRSYESLDYDKLIFNELLNSYYGYRVEYDGNVFNRDSGSFQEKINSGSLKIIDKFLNVEFQGDWKCADVKLNVEDNVGTIIQQCKFEMKDAYYNYLNGKVEYKDLEDILENIYDLSLGAYYIPVNSCINSDNNGRYEWKVTSDRNNLSTMRIQVSDDKPPQILNFRVDTLLGENNNSCYINFQNNFYDCDDSSGPGNSPFGPGSNNKYKFVYRSISVKNPFPTGKIYDNWQNYYNKYKNFDRIHNSYDKLEYESIKLSTSVLKELKRIDYSYTEFDLNDIKKIVNSNFFKSIGTGCPFGEWADDWGTGCDVIR